MAQGRLAGACGTPYGDARADGESVVHSRASVTYRLGPYNCTGTLAALTQVPRRVRRQPDKAAGYAPWVAVRFFSIQNVLHRLYCSTTMSPYAHRQDAQMPDR